MNFEYFGFTRFYSYFSFKIIEINSIYNVPGDIHHLFANEYCNLFSGNIHILLAISSDFSVLSKWNNHSVHLHVHYIQCNMNIVIANSEEYA